jgi:uncharacterized repeat protein (TIGR01451 family)
LSCAACNLGATGTLTWTVGTLSPTTSAAFSLTVFITDTVPAGTTLTNTAEITTTDLETDLTNNSDTWVTAVSAFDLSMDKDGPLYGMIGETLVYTLTFTNQGVATATNVILTDTLPLSTTYVADNSSISPTVPIPGVYVWSLAMYPPIP